MLVLYRCPSFAAWLSATACARLKLSLRPAPKDRVGTWRPMPCFGCPGVVELRARRETPKPRRIEA